MQLWHNAVVIVAGKAECYFVMSKSKLYLLSHGSPHSFHMSPVARKPASGTGLKLKNIFHAQHNRA